MVKILGIVGSPRNNGNTSILVKKALKAAESVGVDVEFINIGSMDLQPCIACDICKSTGECAIYDDMQSIIDKILLADGIIIGSPVYFGSMTSQTKMFMDRTRPLRSDFKLKDKIGGAITVGGARNGGQETTCAAIHHFMLIHDMIVVGDGKPLAHYGGTGIGGAMGETENDEFGLESSENLGKRIAEMAKKINK
ncbi:MAG: flavodoxin family protein [Methanobacteriaceae archaeon]|nr:flavodoxin family protein [Methanobacteriaceae archaeon]